MPQPAINLSVDFIFPRLHGLWSKSFFGDRLDVLVRGGLDGFGRALSERDVQVTYRTEVQKRLTIHFIQELAGVRRFLPSGLRDFYGAFIRRYFYEDIKTVVRGWHRGEEGVQLRDLLILSDEFPELPVEKMLAAKNVNQFYRLFPEPKLRERILPVLVELEDRDDVWLAESRIDRLMMAEFHAAASRLGGGTKRVAKRLVGQEIDIENMVLLLRKNSVADFPMDRLQSFVLDNGRELSADRVMQLAQLATWRDVVEGLPSCYAGGLRKSFDSEPHRIENGLWCEFHKTLTDLFRDFNQPVMSAIAFPYMKRFEVLNLARVFEGLHLGLEPQFIHSILVR
jgi:vacuolar-type H+-ATPase subunit C/Vma6